MEVLETVGDEEDGNSETKKLQLLVTSDAGGKSASLGKMWIPVVFHGKAAPILTRPPEPFEHFWKVPP